LQLAASISDAAPRQVFGLSGARPLARRTYWAGFPSSLELSADSPFVPNYRCGAVPGCAPDSLLGLPVGAGTAGGHKILCPKGRRQLVYTAPRFGCARFPADVFVRWNEKGTRFEFAAAPATVTGERSSDTPLRLRGLGKVDESEDPGARRPASHRRPVSGRGARGATGQPLRRHDGVVVAHHSVCTLLRGNSLN
jgi:hypothetical protein